MDKLRAAPRILLRVQGEGTMMIQAAAQMMKSHAEQKKVDTKGYILHDSIYMIFKNWQGIP